MTEPPTPGFDARTIDTSGAITLVVARRSGRTYKGNRIIINNDVGDGLRDACRQTLGTLALRTAVRYADDMAFDPESQYVVVPSAVLVTRQSTPSGRRHRADGQHEAHIELDPGATQVLANASSLPEISSRDVKNQAFTFYAAVVGDHPDHRVGFVDRWNPYKAALSGHLLTSFGDRLTRLEGPVLVFERSCDMIVTDTAVAVLDLQAFEAVFRDIDAMAGRRQAWSQAAIEAIPFDQATADMLAGLCANNGRVAVQLRGMYERGVFASRFTAAQLRDAMREHELDAGRIMARGHLVLEANDVPVVLKLIDERLYRGWHSGTQWDVAARSKRTT